MITDTPALKPCKCGSSPRIICADDCCQIFCRNHAVTVAANYRAAVEEWNSLPTVKGEGDGH